MTQKDTTKQAYSFLTESIMCETIEIKGQKKYYVEGYISTPDQDLYDDIVTKECLESMHKQLGKKSITLDYDHEAFRDSDSILPVGKIIDSRIDEKGLFVRAQLNPDSPKFKNLWGSLKGGFLKAFSIAFKPIKTTMKAVGEKVVRMLDDVLLLNVALTGVPVNPAASVTGYDMKSVMQQSMQDLSELEGDAPGSLVLIPRAHLKSLEENSMTEEKPVEAPMAEPTKVEASVEAKTAEEKPVEEAPATPEETPAETKSESEQYEKVIEEMKSMAKKLEDTKNELKATKEELKALAEKPVFKSMAPTTPAQAEEKPRSVLEMI